MKLSPEKYNPSQKIPYQWIVWEGNDTIRELYGNEWPDAVVRAFNRLYQRLSHQDMQAKYGLPNPPKE